MKAISITLETINPTTVRVTGRRHGSTAYWSDGHPSTARSLVRRALKETARGHQISDDNWDLTHIELNPAALAVLLAN